MENNPYPYLLYEVYENSFHSIILISQTPFYYEKCISIQLVGTRAPIPLCFLGHPIIFNPGSSEYLENLCELIFIFQSR